MQLYFMSNITVQLKELYNRTPRRHTDDNVKEINSIITEYEDILIAIESTNAVLEKEVAAYFEILASIQTLIKQSTDRKASKKNKDNYFDEASGMLKDNMETLIETYNNNL